MKILNIYDLIEIIIINLDSDSMISCTMKLHGNNATCALYQSPHWVQTKHANLRLSESKDASSFEKQLIISRELNITSSVKQHDGGSRPCKWLGTKYNNANEHYYWMILILRESLNELPHKQSAFQSGFKVFHANRISALWGTCMLIAIPIGIKLTLWREVNCIKCKHLVTVFPIHKAPRTQKVRLIWNICLIWFEICTRRSQQHSSCATYINDANVSMIMISFVAAGNPLDAEHICWCRDTYGFHEISSTISIVC